MAGNNSQTAPRPLALLPAQGSRPPLIVGPSKKYILIHPSALSQNTTPLESTVRRPFCVINQNAIPSATPLENAARRPLLIVNQAKSSSGKNDAHIAHAQEVSNILLSSRVQGFDTGSIPKPTAEPSKVITAPLVKKSFSLSQAKNPIDSHIAHARELSNKVLSSHVQGSDTGFIPKPTAQPSKVITAPLVKKSFSLSQAKNPIDSHIAHARELSNKVLSSHVQGSDTGSIPKPTAQPFKVITAPLVKKSLSLSQAKNPIDSHIAHARELSNKILSSYAQGSETGSIPKQTLKPSKVITAPSPPTPCHTENLERNVIPADVVTLQSSADESDLSDDAFQPSVRKKKALPNTTPATENTTGGKRTNCRKIAGCRKTAEELASIVQMAREKSLSDPSFTKIHENMPSFMADYVITEATLSPNPHKEGDGDFWTAKIRINISDKAGVYEWLSNYENVSACDFRVSFSKKENSKRLVFKKEYHCHHNTKPRDRPHKTEKSKNWKSKNTSCPSIIRFTIKQKSMDWSSDYLLKEYPCEIFIRHQHNHPVQCADAQRLRRPTVEVKEKFEKLFAQGHSPISAIETHKFDLMMEHGEDYIYVAADGTKCPTNFWVYKLYKKVSVSHYGPQSGEGLIESLRAFALKYNDEMKSECIKVELQNDRDLIVAVCTPMMKRTHELLRSSGEMIFVDSSGNMDALNCRVFPVMTHSVAGALPLGIVIVTSESEGVLRPALEVLKTILPPKAFYGRGANVGPKIAMTDDCTNERNSLKGAFPGIILLLCLFHLLQAFWRYLWKRENHVGEKHRPELFYVLRDLAYAPDQSTFDQKVEEAMADPLLLSHQNILDHIKKYVQRSEEWALFQRNDLLTRGNNTNNYSEATMRIIIDKVLRRTKAFNVVQLLDFLVTRLTVYIEMRVTDVLNNRSINAFKSRYFIRPEKLEKLVSEKLPEFPDCYKVTNTAKGTTYIVIMCEEICSCPEGKCGKPCKHLCKVVQDFNLSSELLLPREQVGEATKLVLFEILHGHRNIPTGWFRMLHQSGSVPSTTQDEIVECPDDSVPDAEQLNMSPPDPAADNDEDSSIVLLSTEKELKDLFTSWIDSLKKRPDIFLKPCQKLIEASKKIKDSDSALVSAMMCFGKRTGDKPLCVQKYNQQNTIPVQTKARRKVHLEGRRAQHGGRPPKDMYQPPVVEHGYNNETSGTKRKATEAHWASIPNKRAFPAPHALQVCVNANKTIGKNLSKK